MISGRESSTLGFASAFDSSRFGVTFFVIPEVSFEFS